MATSTIAKKPVVLVGDGNDVSLHQAPVHPDAQTAEKECPSSPDKAARSVRFTPCTPGTPSGVFDAASASVLSSGSERPAFHECPSLMNMKPGDFSISGMTTHDLRSQESSEAEFFLNSPNDSRKSSRKSSRSNSAVVGGTLFSPVTIDDDEFRTNDDDMVAEDVEDQ